MDGIEVKHWQWSSDRHFLEEITIEEAAVLLLAGAHRLEYADCMRKGPGVIYE